MVIAEGMTLGLPPAALVEPAVALAAVTLLVWLRLYQIRLVEMHRRGIDPQALAGSVAKTATMQDTRASDNFGNLFEMPVLFYVGVFGFLAAGLPVGGTDVLLAWSYVILRAVHSLIHCTWNRVVHRFVAYLLSSIVLVVFLGRLAFGLYG